MEEEIDYRVVGLKTMQDWHDTEGMGDAEHELISGLVASIHSVILLPDVYEATLLNCIKVALESAYQLGRANPTH